jgi:hypothetical protein
MANQEVLILRQTQQSEPVMPRDQARNLVMHGDPNGQVSSVIEIADSAAIPAELAEKFGQPYMIEKFVPKGAPRLPLKVVDIKLDTTNLSTPEAMAAEFARLQQELQGAEVYSRRLIQASEKGVQQINFESKHATRGEEQRAIIFNRIRAKAYTWAKQLHEGITPTYEVKATSKEGVTKAVIKPVEQHLVFALVNAAKSMYQRELSDSPAKDLADIAKQADFDEEAVEKELARRKLKLEDKASTPNEAQVDEDVQEEVETHRKSLEALRKEEEEEHPFEAATLEEQIVFTLKQVKDILANPAMDEPNPEAGKRIRAMMEVRL